MIRVAMMIVLWLFAALLTAADLSDDAVAVTALETGLPRDRAVERGLVWVRAQAGSDGGLGESNRIALTALGLLAHYANGVTPSDPHAGAWMARALDFVLAGQDIDGYLGRSDGSRMYGHGIATLLLAEAAGACGDEAREQRVRDALVRAIGLTLRAQQVAKPEQYRGGWRYGPNDANADLSLSGWQLLSLHASRQIGLPVPPEALLDGAAFARSLIGEQGTVGYEARGDDHPALRGLALLVLVLGQGPGAAPAPEIAAITRRITDDPIAWQGSFFYYRAYYDAVGLARAAPTTWETYGPRLEKILVEHQATDGSWPVVPGSGEELPVYRASMALLALSVDRHLLPAHHF